MVRRFRSLFERPLHPDARVVDVEISPDGVPPDARIFMMDEGDNEVFDSSEEFLDSSLELLPDTDPYREEDFSLDSPVDTDFDPFTINIEETVSWLARCWNNAGGGWSDIPAYVCPHDDIRSFDLRKGHWSNDAEDKYLFFSE